MQPFPCGIDAIQKRLQDGIGSGHRRIQGTKYLGQKTLIWDFMGLGAENVGAQAQIPGDGKIDAFQGLVMDDPLLYDSPRHQPEISPRTNPPTSKTASQPRPSLVGDIVYSQGWELAMALRICKTGLSLWTWPSLFASQVKGSRATIGSTVSGAIYPATVPKMLSVSAPRMR